jgi:hypothetical protein
MKSCLAINKASNQSGAVVDKALNNLQARRCHCEVQRTSASVISGAWVVTLLAEPLLDVVQVLVDDGLAEKLSVANVSHVGVLLGAERVEAADGLSSAVVFHELDRTRYIDLALLLGGFFFFDRDRSGAVAATVANHVVHRSKESRMTVKIDFTIFSVPLRVQNCSQALVLIVTQPEGKTRLTKILCV